MTDDGRGLFDDAPSARGAPGTDATAGIVAGRPDPDAIDPDEVQPRSQAAIPDEPVIVDPPSTATPASRADDDGRPVALRLAGLHVRMGSLALARAELESLAGRGMLDEDALLDLAEVRWRTGDLAGAGEAANALLARERTDTLALVIAAEAVAGAGRPGEARRLAARAVERADGPLDPLFAGIPRSLVWPGEDPDEASTPDAPGEPMARATTPGGAAAPRTPPETPASTGAAEAYAGGRAALAAGDTTQAAVRLGVALRLEPGYARDVLSAIGDQAADPALALVAGDALRLLGRESEALAAFDLARGHVHSPEEPHVRDAATGAGEDDPG